MFEEEKNVFYTIISLKLIKMSFFSNGMRYRKIILDIIFSPPTFRKSEGDYCFEACPFVCSFVRIFLRDHPLKLSEILHEVVTSDRLKSDILRFLKKNLVRAPGAQKGSKWPKMTLLGQ